MPPERVILSFIGIIIVLVACFYVTSYVAKRASGQTRTGRRTGSINMLDRYAIARDKQFCIIESAGKVYLIGITNHTMTLLDTFDAAAFAELTENNDEPIPWNMTPVGMYGNKLTRKVVEFIATKTGKIQPQTYNEKPDESASKFSDTMTEAQRTASDEPANEEPLSEEPAADQPEKTEGD